MRFEGNMFIKAPAKKVWDYLMNVRNLADCIPGCEELEVIDERTFRSLIKNKVAFLSVKFNSTTNITEIDPHYRLTATTKGKDSLIRTDVNIKSGFKLESPFENETRLSYWSDVNIVGKLATFGESTIRGKGKKILKEFEQNLKNKIEGT